ncbi:exopolysaccharide biosynthesis polyprenyl glycosylphosphotransferase [Acidisoma sp. 7E03]
MPRRSLDAVLTGSDPHRLSAPHPAVVVAAADFVAVAGAGLLCRGLNPAGHAAHTPRELVVVLVTAGLAVLLLHRRCVTGQGAQPARGVEALLCLAHAFALLLLALLFWEQVMSFHLGAGAPPEADAILASNRNWLFAWAVTAPLLLALTRATVAAFPARQTSPPPARRAVVVGDAAGAARLARALARGGPGPALEIAGALILTRWEEAGAPPAGWPRLQGLAALRRTVAQGEADLLLVALPQRADRSIAALMRVMAGLALDIWLAPDIARLYAAPARLSPLGGLPFLHLQERPIAGRAAVVKRAEDLALGLPLLLMAAPLMLAIAVAIRLSSPGPALFVQPRLGLNRSIIQVRKFRTMTREASDPAGARQTVAGDARVTPLGRVLRRSSLDELPQLLNVVGGSMSLVGPRPHALGSCAAGRPFAEAAADYAARHRVKPGMTGWAQVQGWRGETDTAEKLRQRVAHDLHYIAHWSLWLDLRILALTLRAMWRGEGV